ncbi:MAG: dihydroneopterin aldolase [Pseudomonadales bacterium]
MHYGDVARRVEAFIREGRYELLETLAEATTTLLLSEYPISAVTLTVRKPAAIAGATAAGIRIHRAR